MSINCLGNIDHSSYMAPFPLEALKPLNLKPQTSNLEKPKLQGNVWNCLRIPTGFYPHGRWVGRLGHRDLHASFNPKKREHCTRPRMFSLLIAQSNCGKSPFFCACIDAAFMFTFGRFSVEGTFPQSNTEAQNRLYKD